MDRKEESYSRITADVKSICHRQYNMIYLMCSFERAIFYKGDWSNGMIGVSKTFGGSSILSSPAFSIDLNACKYRCFGLFLFYKKES